MTVAVCKAQREAKKEKLTMLVWEGNSPTRAIDSMGISKHAYYNWRQTDQDWAKELDAININNVAIIEDVLFEKAKAGHIRAIEIFLFNRARDKWKSVNYLRHEGPQGGPIQHNHQFDAGQLSTPRLRQLQEILEEGTVGGDEPGIMDPLHGNGARMTKHRNGGSKRNGGSSHKNGKNGKRSNGKAKTSGKGKGK